MAIQTIPSLQAAARLGKKICVKEKFQDVLEATYPEFKGSFIWMNPLDQLQTMHMPNALCDAAIVGQNYVDSLIKHDDAYCNLEPVGEPLFVMRGGWATNLQSACLEDAMNYAIEKVFQSGLLPRLWQKWFPRAVCPALITEESGKLDIADMAGLLLCCSFLLFLVVLTKTIGRAVLMHTKRQQEQEAAAGIELNDMGIDLKDVDQFELEDANGHLGNSSTQNMHQLDPLTAMRNLIAEYDGHRDPLLAPLLTRIVKTLFPRYDFDQSGTLNSEEEITQITINVFLKMIEVIPMDKTCLDEAVKRIQQTYCDAGKSFVFTADEYVEWLLPFLASEAHNHGNKRQTGKKRSTRGGRR